MGKVLYYKMKSGNKKKISDMSTGFIHNAITLLKRKNQHDATLLALEQEMEKRALVVC